LVGVFANRVDGVREKGMEGLSSGSGLEMEGGLKGWLVVMYRILVF
jgi:hypothetical protein